MGDSHKDMRIDIIEDGPYVISGGVPLVRLEIVTDEQGQSVDWRETGRLDVPSTYDLCRCGASRDKPFCDFSHNAVGFDGEETAKHDLYFQSAAKIPGPSMDLFDVQLLCARARFCYQGGGIWHAVERCDDPEVAALVEKAAGQCPAGRYVVCDKEDCEGQHEPVLEPSIGLVEDPHAGVSGPLYVRGGVPVFAADGEGYEVRNRVTLCRCGASANKPFCDGAHIASGFREDR